MDTATDVGNNIRNQRMPEFRHILLKNENGCQKRKTCRKAVECPALFGFRR